MDKITTTLNKTKKQLKFKTMKNSKILLLSLLAFLFFFSACEEDETVKINETKILAEYLGEYINTDPVPAMISATDVNNAILASSSTISIIDIRDASTYAAGHIEGAVNVTLANLLTYYETNNLQTKTTVVIACFSGQTASYATSLLRMLGYTNVKALKWGMSSWNAATKGSWANNIGNSYTTSMVTTAGTKNAEGALPEINTGETTGDKILRARIEQLLTEGFDPAKITKDAAFSNSTTNYTANYWIQDHYNVGHIPGAVQYTPKLSFSLAQELKTLPANKTIVVYCYTGQTSAFTAAYLRVLGYDAKSLLYGANGMMYDAMGTYNTTATTKMTVFKEATDVFNYTLVQ